MKNKKTSLKSIVGTLHSVQIQKKILNNIKSIYTRSLETSVRVNFHVGYSHIILYSGNVDATIWNLHFH